MFTDNQASTILLMRGFTQITHFPIKNYKKYQMDSLYVTTFDSISSPGALHCIFQRGMDQTKINCTDHRAFIEVLDRYQ